jgi:CBS domain-containing protein
VDPATTLQEFVSLHVLRHGRRAVLVAGEDGRLRGLVTVSDVKEAPQTEWPATPLDRVMTPVPLKTVTPDSDVNDALRLLAEDDLHQVPVVADGRVVGLLSRGAILRLVQLHDALRLGSDGRASAEQGRVSRTGSHAWDARPTGRAA